MPLVTWATMPHRTLSGRECSFGEDTVRARTKLQQYVSSVRMTPTEQQGERFYVADGEWDMLGNAPKIVQSDPADPGLHFPMVAGARNVPKVHFRFEICRDFKMTGRARFQNVRPAV
jgi:hypothetical protein